MDLKLNIPNGTYLISPEEINNIEYFTQELNLLFTNSTVRIFQLRLKNNLVENIAQKIKTICDKHNILFVLNDDIKLAVKNNFALHVGKADGDFKAVKSKLDIVGTSCYNDVGRALEMAEQGASYVSFGAFFQSPTKPMATRCNLSVISDFRKKNQNTKISTIGGINGTNAKPLIQEGANFICICSAVWQLKTYEEKADEINKINNLFN